MWAALIVILILVVVFARSLGFAPPLQSRVILRIQNGELRVQKGRLAGMARNHVDEILTEEHVLHGWIAILANRRIVFSRAMPAGLQQRLRNVLVNRHVE